AGRARTAWPRGALRTRRHHLALAARTGLGSQRILPRLHHRDALLPRRQDRRRVPDEQQRAARAGTGAGRTAQRDRRHGEGGAVILETERLELVRATADRLRADLAGP